MARNGEPPAWRRSPDHCLDSSLRALDGHLITVERPCVWVGDIKPPESVVEFAGR